jgi:VanZ family protein
MRKLALWGPVVVWAAVIFAFSSVPSLSSGLGTWDEVLRKGAHITEYAILGALLFRALGRELPALAVGIAYAATDEVHQHFVSGRHSSPFDVAFDASGLALGLLVLLSVETAKPAKPAKPAWPSSRRRERAP